MPKENIVKLASHYFNGQAIILILLKNILKI
jgi:hypothetical protein